MSTIHAFPDSEHLARRVAKIGGTGFALIASHQFPDRETLVRVRPPVGRDTAVLRSLDDPNRKLVEILLAADALRRAGARTAALVCPYLSYMRQDKVFHPGEPLSQSVIGRTLSGSFDRIVTVEPHLHRIRGLTEVFQCRAQSLSAAPAIAGWIRKLACNATVVAGPDMESGRLVREVGKLTGLESIVGVKQRLRDRSVKISFGHAPKASAAVIVDDVASSGATLAVAVRALRRMNIHVINVVVVHALFERGAIARIRRAGARRIVSCDTIAHPSNGIETASLLAEALADSAE